MSVSCSEVIVGAHFATLDYGRNPAYEVFMRSGGDLAGILRADIQSCDGFRRVEGHVSYLSGCQIHGMGQYPIIVSPLLRKYITRKKKKTHQVVAVKY